MIPLKTDTHLHTNFSPDADKDATFEAYIKRAKELNLSTLIFTDHLDLDAAHPLFEKPINYDEYVDAFERVKNESKFDMRMGIEIGYQPHTIKDTMEIVNKYPFEYVILSIHYIDKMDLYTKEYFQGKTKKEAYTRYLDTCLEAIKNTPRFDAFGHLDYIPRYSGLGDYEYEEYKTQIDEILKELVKRDKILEINTSGFRYEGRAYPKKEVIDRYLELGGRKLSIGSDAHRVSELGRNFDQFESYSLRKN